MSLKAELEGGIKSHNRNRQPKESQVHGKQGRSHIDCNKSICLMCKTECSKNKRTDICTEYKHSHYDDDDENDGVCKCGHYEFEHKVKHKI